MRALKSHPRQLHSDGSQMSAIAFIEFKCVYIYIIYF